jgi:hypothetical protein
MNPDDEYQAWLNGRRSASPSEELTERIMSAVRESAMSRTSARSTEMTRSTIWQRAIPYLVCSAAALVLSVRIYSIVSLFVVASPIADVAMFESKQELSNEP